MQPKEVEHGVNKNMAIVIGHISVWLSLFTLHELDCTVKVRNIEAEC